MWVTPRIESLAARREVGVADLVPLADGPVYAVVVGVSQYQKLAAHEQLQYADVDARLLAQFLSSERGGKAPPTSAVRNSIAANAEQPGVLAGDQRGSYIYTARRRCAWRRCRTCSRRG